MRKCGEKKRQFLTIIFSQPGNKLFRLHNALLLLHRHNGIEELGETVEQMLLLEHGLLLLLTVAGTLGVAGAAHRASDAPVTIYI